MKVSFYKPEQYAEKALGRLVAYCSASNPKKYFIWSLGRGGGQNVNWGYIQDEKPSDNNETFDL